jgi:hypothetical protein
MQASAKDPQHVLLSIALPPPPPETVFSGGLPFGAMEAVNAAFGPLIQVLDPPEAGFHLTIRLDLTKLAGTEGMYKTTNPLPRPFSCLYPCCTCMSYFTVIGDNGFQSAGLR